MPSKPPSWKFIFTAFIVSCFFHESNASSSAEITIHDPVQKIANHQPEGNNNRFQSTQQIRILATMELSVNTTNTTTNADIIQLANSTTTNTNNTTDGKSFNETTEQQTAAVSNSPTISPTMSSSSTEFFMPSSIPTTTLTPTTVPIISASSCDDLGWDNAADYGSLLVCGESELPELKCQGYRSWASADDLCKSVGARLCTSQELQDDETKGTGCGLDDQLLWSSTACNKGYFVAYASSVVGTGATCIGESERYSFRCCADVVVVVDDVENATSSSSNGTAAAAQPTTNPTASPIIESPTASPTTTIPTNFVLNYSPPPSPYPSLAPSSLFNSHITTTTISPSIMPSSSPSSSPPPRPVALPTTAINTSFVAPSNNNTPSPSPTTLDDDDDENQESNTPSTLPSQQPPTTTTMTPTFAPSSSPSLRSPSSSESKNRQNSNIIQRLPIEQKVTAGSAIAMLVIIPVSFMTFRHISNYYREKNYIIKTPSHI